MSFITVKYKVLENVSIYNPVNHNSMSITGLILLASRQTYSKNSGQALVAEQHGRK